jgi:putative phosphoserine phosphatase/1-acylglycerol-3-phosphate O-acyltransferase
MPVITLTNHLHLIEAGAIDPSKVAFFDLDRTLISGYSIVAMAQERIRHGLNQGDVRGSAAILKELVRQRKSLAAGQKGSGYHRLVKTLSHSLTGISEETLMQLGEKAYQKSIARSLYSEAVTLLEAHRKAGHYLVIVTAATRYQVEPIARVLGVDDVCCTGLEVEQGVFTGKTLAPLCYGEGKAMAARRICKQRGTSLKNSWFYSDSIDDLPLLRKVGKPVAVNASRKLADYAESRNWPQLRFQTRGVPNIETVIRTLLTLQTVAATTALCAVGKRLGMGKIANARRSTSIIGEIGSGFAGIDLEVEGAANLNLHQPAVFIFNHQSMLDGMVLAHLLKRDVVALCKKEMADNPLIGPLLRQTDTIFVDRASKDQSSVLKKALGTLQSGRSLIIAPEGTRSTLGDIQPFKHGAFFIAKKAGVPVIPIVLHNVKDALPNGGLLIRATTVRVTVMPAVDPRKMGGVRQACEKMEKAYARVLNDSHVAALPRIADRRHSDISKMIGDESMANY